MTAIPSERELGQQVDVFIRQVAFAKFPFANYDGGMPAHTEPEQSGIFLLTKDGRWQVHPENSSVYFFGGLSAYTIQAQERGERSCSVLLYDNEDSSVRASFALPATGAAELQNAVAECRAEALRQAEDPRTAVPSETEPEQQLQQLQRGLVDIVSARKRIELQVEQLLSADAKLQNQARQALAQNSRDVAREALTRRATISTQIKALTAQRRQLNEQEDRILSVNQQRLGPTSLHCPTAERRIEVMPPNESEATPTLAPQKAWWEGVQPAKLRGLELNPGRKPDYTGTLYVTERAGLKDDGPSKIWGLYYKGGLLGGGWWLPLGGVSKIELAEADLHPSGTGFIGFGLVGMAAVLAARSVSHHRAKAVRVLTITDRKGTAYQFQTKLSTAYVVKRLGSLVQLYTAKVAADNQVLADEKALMNEELLKAEDEKRKGAIREQAEAIAQAVAPQVSMADELTKLAQLKEAGVLTEEEFAAQKAKLLS